MSRLPTPLKLDKMIPTHPPSLFPVISKYTNKPTMDPMATPHLTYPLHLLGFFLGGYLLFTLIGAAGASSAAFFLCLAAIWDALQK